MELLNNPFFRLGATMQDNRRRIMDLAEEKSLVADEVGVRDATAVLTNPRRRLEAEIGWLPGLKPADIAAAISMLEREPDTLRITRGVPSLARANLLADGFVRAIERLSERDAALWVVELANAHDEIDGDQTIRILNEERSVAGFPMIAESEYVETELQGRRQYYTQAIKRALDKLPSSSLLQVVTIAVDEGTYNGDRQAPILIDDLVDSFEIEAQAFLGAETENIATLIKGLRNAVAQEKERAQIESLVTTLESVVRSWDRVAQPIQVSARSRGIRHDHSDEVAGEIRNLAVELFNKHGLLNVSKRLTSLMQEVFAENDRVLEQSEKDASQLDEIAEQRREYLAEMEGRADSWRREITYEAEIGLIFKNKLRISPDGVQWRGMQIPLAKIQRVRWGGISHHVNGVPTGTTYTIFIGGSDLDYTIIELKKQSVHSQFIQRLWKAVGMRLLTEMLEGLRAGKSYQFGSVVVTDHGIELERPRLFRANERVRWGWTNLLIGNGAGTLTFSKKDDTGVAIALPYLEIDNLHILEAALRVFWKTPSLRLSDLLGKAS